MSRLPEHVVHEDRPSYGLGLRLVLVGIPALLIIGAFFAWQRGENSAALTFFMEALVISLIFWVVAPRRYQVLPDRLRIVLGGPFAFRVGFANVKEVTNSSGVRFGVNFSTTISRTQIEIVRKRGPRIGITPTNPQLFASFGEIGHFLGPIRPGSRSNPATDRGGAVPSLVKA